MKIPESTAVDSTAGRLVTLASDTLASDRAAVVLSTPVRAASTCAGGNVLVDHRDGRLLSDSVLAAAPAAPSVV